MSIRSLILSFAADSKCTLDEAAEAIHAEIDNTVVQYKGECEAYQTACDEILDENPSVTKEALIPMVAMKLSGSNPAKFAETLRGVGEYVNLTYVGKRGRRKADDTSARLSRR